MIFVVNFDVCRTVQRVDQLVRYLKIGRKLVRVIILMNLLLVTQRIDRAEHHFITSFLAVVRLLFEALYILVFCFLLSQIESVDYGLSIAHGAV